MSGKKLVLAARLNGNNPNKPYDDQVIEIWERWKAKRWTMHDFVVRAVLALEGQEVTIPTTESTALQLQKMINQLEAMLRNGELIAGDEGEGEQSITDAIATISRSLPRATEWSEDDEE